MAVQCLQEYYKYIKATKVWASQTNLKGQRGERQHMVMEQKIPPKSTCSRRKARQAIVIERVIDLTVSDVTFD